MEGYRETVRGISRPDNDHNESIELVPRSDDEIAHALGIDWRRVRLGFGMRVPIADEVMAALVPFENFRLLAASVRPEAKPAANIIRAGRRRFRNDDIGAVKPGEELAACFALPRPALTIAGKSVEDGLGKNKCLSRGPDRIGNHAAAASAIGVVAASGQHLS